MSLTEGTANWRLIVAVVDGNESNYGRTMLLLRCRNGLRTMLLLSLAVVGKTTNRLNDVVGTNCCCRYRLSESVVGNAVGSGLRNGMDRNGTERNGTMLLLSLLEANCESERNNCCWDKLLLLSS